MGCVCVCAHVWFGVYGRDEELGEKQRIREVPSSNILNILGFK